MNARRQKIYGVSSLVRSQYRMLRRNHFSIAESRLMVIGACVLDRDRTYYSKEWVIRAHETAMVGGLHGG